MTQVKYWYLIYIHVQREQTPESVKSLGSDKAVTFTQAATDQGSGRKISQEPLLKVCINESDEDEADKDAVYTIENDDAVNHTEN